MPWRPFLSAQDRSAGGGGVRSRPGVLVVLGEDPLRALIRRTLEDEGYRVLEARDSAEALVALAILERPLDLVLADLSEPGITGPDGLVKRLAPATRVLLLSLFTEDDTTPGRAVEGLPVLRNPFRSDVLRDKVREVLQGR
jgi:DNA-binding response OmpR family regulator